MNKIVLSGIAITSCLILAGCAPSKGTWVNPELIHTSKTTKKIEYGKADGYCDQVSYGSVPMPDVSIPSSNNYSTSGTFRARSTYTGDTYTGTYSQNTYNSGGFAGGLADGYARGAAIGAMRKAEEARINVWKSCMYRLGWVTESEYQEIKFDEHMTILSTIVNKDKKYKGISLKTDKDMEWFRDLSRKLWDKKITKSTYMKEALKRYPSKEYEFNVVANGILQN